MLNKKIRLINKLSRALLVLAVTSILGCIEEKSEYTINPDGSGKVDIEALFQSFTFSLDGPAANAPEVVAKSNVKRILEESKGVEAWRDISYKMTEDDRISFKATAYFSDISKLDIHNLRTLPFAFSRNEKGDISLELKVAGKEPDESGQTIAVEKLSEEEIGLKIETARKNYQKSKTMLTSFLSEMRISAVFYLPGRISSVTNFKENPDGTLSITLEGTKMVDAINTLSEDENWWRRQVISGRDLIKDGPEFDPAMNEILFGQKAPVRATITGDLKALFKYQAEVTDAKNTSKEIMRELGIFESITIEPAKGGALKNIKVGGVRIVNFSDQVRGIRPFSDYKGYVLAIIADFPCSVLNVTGTLEKALTDNGENLLHEREFDRKTKQVKLSGDKTSALFQVKLPLPSEDVKYFKEISGTLEYSTASVAKEVDLGFTELKAGAIGKELGSIIKSVGERFGQKDKEYISFDVGLDHSMVKSITFYDSNGKKLDVFRNSSSRLRDKVNYFYSIKGKFPPTSRIVVEVYEDYKKFKVPFKVTNISLLGRPVKTLDESH